MHTDPSGNWLYVLNILFCKVEGGGHIETVKVSSCTAIKAYLNFCKLFELLKLRGKDALSVEGHFV